MVAAEKDFEQFPGQSIPIQNPCLSFWQRTTRAFSLLNANRNESTPLQSKIVVVGSGLAGALTAFSLIESGIKGRDIVILEAREAASGASSRNAGHVRPDAFRGFSAYSRVHGPDQALKIIQNEKIVLQKVDEFVTKHGVDCNFHHTTTFDVSMSKGFSEYQAESFEAYKAAGGDVSHVKFYSGDEAKKQTRVPDAIDAYEWPAGSSHPAKLAQFLLKSVVASGAQLFTHCPALRIEKAASQPTTWNIETRRGSVEAEIVIHCTNAHASFLLPQLAPFITPNRAQAHSIIPPAAFSAENTLTKTFSLRYSLFHFYSVIQRQDDGIIILGVSRSNPTLSAKALAGRTSTDDSSYDDEICQDATKNFGQIFKQGAESSVYGEGLEHPWSGIIGMTTDSVPFVGAIDGLDGQFICAGFNGHGMARIFTCAPGLVKLILGGGWEDTGLPECFAFSKERLAKLSGGAVQSVW